MLHIHLSVIDKFGGAMSRLRSSSDSVKKDGQSLGTLTTLDEDGEPDYSV